MLDKHLIYQAPKVDILAILSESILTGSIEDPEVNPEIDW
jgi:hypothetical protein